MTGFEKDVIDRLGRIETKLDSDFRALHGNGHPGLIQQQVEMEKRLSALETAQEPTNGELGQSVKDLKKYHENGNAMLNKVASIGSWIITTAIAAYAAIRSSM